MDLPNSASNFMIKIPPIFCLGGNIISLEEQTASKVHYIITYIFMSKYNKH